MTTQTIVYGICEGPDGRLLSYASFWKQNGFSTIQSHRSYVNPSVHLIDRLVRAVIRGGFSVIPDRIGWTATRKNEPQ